MANKVTLTFAGDSKSLEKTFDGVGSSADKARGRFGGLSTGAKILSGVALGGLAIAAKNAWDGLKSGEKVAAQTEAVIKSTGGTARVTAKHVDDLAIALSNKSGVDDELIAKGQNVLLTFTNIRNEVGKGNNIFDQATQTVLDMSVALGTDMAGQSIQLGKALNDPIKGISALSKVGVTFTQAQRDQIKAMVDAGNTAGAQKVILQELQKEFGGSADAAGKTMAGQLNVAKLQLERLSEEVLTAVLPAITAMIGVVTTAASWLSQHEGITKILVATLAALAVGVWLVNAAVKAYTAVQLVLNAVLTANPIGLVILAIAALAAGIIIAYQQSGTFRQIVQGAFDAVKVAANAVKVAVEGIVTAIKAAWDSPVAGAIKTYYVTQFNAIKTAVEAVVTVIETIVGAVKAANDSKVLSGIKQAFGDTFSPIKDVVNTVVDALKNVVSWATTAFNKVSSVVNKAKSIGDKLNPFADGGIVTSPTRALIGEAGPEVVIPLTKPARAMELLRTSGLMRMGGGRPELQQSQQQAVSPVHIDKMIVQDATDAYVAASQLGRMLGVARA